MRPIKATPRKVYVSSSRRYESPKRPDLWPMGGTRRNCLIDTKRTRERKENGGKMGLASISRICQGAICKLALIYFHESRRNFASENRAERRGNCERDAFSKSGEPNATNITLARLSRRSIAAGREESESTFSNERDFCAIDKLTSRPHVRG